MNSLIFILDIRIQLRENNKKKLERKKVLKRRIGKMSFAQAKAKFTMFLPYILPPFHVNWIILLYGNISS